MGPDTNVVAVEAFVATEPMISRDDKQKVYCARFRLGINGNAYNTGTNNVTFIDVVGFKEVAEFIEKSVTKGRRVRVLGELGSTGYIDSSGTFRVTCNIVAKEIGFTGMFRPAKEEVLEYQEPVREFNIPDPPVFKGPSPEPYRASEKYQPAVKVKDRKPPAPPPKPPSDAPQKPFKYPPLPLGNPDDCPF